MNIEVMAFGDIESPGSVGGCLVQGSFAKRLTTRARLPRISVFLKFYVELLWFK
jgi:hypothetical protein